MIKFNYCRFGEEVRKRRKEKRLTQAQLAGLVGFKLKASISFIERNKLKAGLYLHFGVPIAKTLDIDLEDFCTWI